jgi:NADH-quinone oxidoreductase subunit F
MDTDFDINEIDEIVARIDGDEESVIPVLQAIQERFRYLPDAALHRVCEITDISPATIEGVATFFTRFRRKPVGEHMISVCGGTACHVKGAPTIYDAIAKHLELSEGEDTDKDGRFTLQKVSCLGCCTLAPAVQIDTVTYGHQRSDTIPAMLADFLRKEKARPFRPRQLPHHEESERAEIRVGLGSCCVAGGSEKVRVALEDALDAVQAPVHVKHVSCVGMCHQTPLLEVCLPGAPTKLYARVQAEDVEQIVLRHFRPSGGRAWLRSHFDQWLERVYTDDGVGAIQRYAIDVRDAHVEDFLGAQRRLGTEYCGEIDPTDLEEYQRKEGFAALRKCLDQKPDDLIAEISVSGLRGRGGAGFPTGRKWQFVRDAQGEKKYIICNGDEGDPGAFMDRMILESYPFRVIEGMIIASLAVGADEGICYIRAEYPLAVRRMREAIALCEEAGLLGGSILNSPHAFRVRVKEGAGAFVCGEETALIASLEGRRGTPAFRPPFPAQEGLHRAPTLVNNTETLALIPWILRNGGEAFAALGTEKSKGTKVFSLAGKIVRGGLIEVPMGLSMRRIIEDIGGGVAHGRTLKAVQVGGPSGGCIPASHCDAPVDYEALIEAGAMMGSGGLVVLDDSDCMVEMTRYFLAFTQNESCGKCTPCRIGTKRMLEMLTRLCNGQGKKGDVERLEELAHLVKEQSLCGLGKTAPNPVLTALRYFRHEFDAHLEGRCPSGSCKALIHYTINKKCIGCTKCAQECPVDAIAMMPYEVHDIDQERCTRCDACRQVCPVDAVDVD